tara:strand:+ start:1971 stop:2408 length:438 start_codon:yes stop_codon:yes gene_type:complete
MSLKQMITISGTIGIRNVVTTLHPDRVEITHKGKTLYNIKSLLLIGLQRVSKQLKMCDVVWVDGETQTPVIQSIPQSSVDMIVQNAWCDVYMLGMDPPPWSKLAASARKNNWQQEDWCHVFSEETTDDDESDEEWLPDDEDYQSS